MTLTRSVADSRLEIGVNMTSGYLFQARLAETCLAFLSNLQLTSSAESTYNYSPENIPLSTMGKGLHDRQLTKPSLQLICDHLAAHEPMHVYLT
jgi:hypothetical protein